MLDKRVKARQIECMANQVHVYAASSVRDACFEMEKLAGRVEEYLPLCITKVNEPCE